jgi:predicted CoA-binding protein
MAMMDADAWQALGYAGNEINAEKCELLYEQFEMRERQIAALLKAHGLDIIYEHCAKGQDPHAVLMA